MRILIYAYRQAFASEWSYWKAQSRTVSGWTRRSEAPHQGATGEPCWNARKSKSSAVCSFWPFVLFYWLQLLREELSNIFFIQVFLSEVSMFYWYRVKKPYLCLQLFAARSGAEFRADIWKYRPLRCKGEAQGGTFSLHSQISPFTSVPSSLLFPPTFRSFPTNLMDMCNPCPIVENLQLFSIFSREYHT